MGKDRLGKAGADYDGIEAALIQPLHVRMGKAYVLEGPAHAATSSAPRARGENGDS